MIEHVGVDGCRFGWLAVFSEHDLLKYRLFWKFAALAEDFPDADILVDIPIGLPWSGCMARPCDVQARRHLGAGRASSVFLAPTRAACRAQDVSEARLLNIGEIGKSLSAQAWGICAKVAEVDTLLLSDPAIKARVREVHPEVCFWALDDEKPMTHSKGTRAGILERLDVLTRREPRSKELLDRVLGEQRRMDVHSDDVLDALVAFVTASSLPSAQLQLRGEPSHDQEDLPMEMVYVRS